MHKLLQTFVTISVCLHFWGCQAANPVGNPNPSTPLDSQLQEAGELNLQSARNHLTQARNVYFQLSPNLIVVDTDVDAYQKMVSEVLPAMLGAANSLTVLSADDTDVNALKTEYQSLFSDIMAQMLLGINNNLRIYQNTLESPQSLEGASEETAAVTLTNLTGLYQATEYTERFTAELSQFQSLLVNSGNVLNGIRNQQSLVINGVLRVAEKVSGSDALQSAYLKLVQSLTRVELLNQLAQLAQRAFGAERVALRQSELTPVQSNPNQVQMVVRETDTRYRLVRIENDRLVNEVITDSRNLSAADLLNQSNVVVIRDNPSSMP